MSRSLRRRSFAYGIDGEPVGGEPCPQLAAGVVEGLVERAARGAKPFGEHVDRHVVERDGDEHGPLMSGEHLGDRVAHRVEELSGLGVGVR
jgi:hypothetical protein